MLTIMKSSKCGVIENEQEGYLRQETDEQKNYSKKTKRMIVARTKRNVCGKKPDKKKCGSKTKEIYAARNRAKRIVARD